MTQLISNAAPSARLRLDGLKARQQAIWAAGDFAVVGATSQIVGETLAETVDLRADERVLDVACGSGNASLAAARRFCEVTGVDYVPAVLARARERAEAERLSIQFVEADAEALPFTDGSFDAVLSTFGAMFSPMHARTARELARVCRPGGRIGLCSWTPHGFIAELYEVVGRHVALELGVDSPLRWGDVDHLGMLFSDVASRVRGTRKEFAFRYASAVHFVELLRASYGPLQAAFAELEALAHTRAIALWLDLIEAVEAHDVGGRGGMVVPAEYLEVVIDKA